MRELLKAELIAAEGVRLKPYKDSEGLTTIGIGRCLDTTGISSDEAQDFLDHDIDRTIADVELHLPWWKSRSDNVQRAMANMAFQMGIGGLLKFNRMLAALQAGDFESAKREALESLWAKQTPNRAKAVTDLFTP